MWGRGKSQARGSSKEDARFKCFSFDSEVVSILGLQYISSAVSTTRFKWYRLIHECTPTIAYFFKFMFLTVLAEGVELSSLRIRSTAA